MPQLPTRVRNVLFRRVLKVGGALHKVLYRASGGRLGGTGWGLPILLLTTTGRKTGKLRTNPLCFYRDGDAFVVVASNGGMDWFPRWWLNLQADPRATVLIGRTRHAVTARKASPEERARLWAEVTAIAPGYLRYERRTRREIPFGILEPIDG
jgi:deazaflavin-dependent oxidoreductase (nitroreductase family)